MPETEPTLKDMDALLAFLPQLETQGESLPIAWRFGETTNPRVMTMPWAEYPAWVHGLVGVASRAPWPDYHYQPSEAGRLLTTPELVATASLAQVRSMLTVFVRGERFCDGHWGAMIGQGHVLRLLRRVQVLRDELARGAASQADPQGGPEQT